MSTPLDWSEPDLVIEVPSTAVPVLDAPSVTGVEVLVVQGKDGAGVNLSGAVATYAELPTGLALADAGQAYVVQSNGLLYVWSGTEWPAEANGSPFKGDKGDTGRGYASVGIAGDKLAFHATDGTTDQVTVPQIAAASASASAAANSATAAAAARDAALAAQEAAEDEAASAASSAAAASTSKDAAATSASNAATYEASAAASATAADASADDAADARDDTAVSATTATNARDTATAAAANAATARDTAATSASTATTAASSATDSADAAAADAQRAIDAADRAESAVNAGVADATATTKGGIRLPGETDGELGGTWDHPTVTGWNRKADLIDGKIPTAQLPSIATAETYVVASIAQRTALTTTQVQRGDIAVQTGNPGRGTYILRDDDPSLEASWVLMNAPTDSVTSVNGYTGSFVLTKADIDLANVDNTSDAAKPISTATQTALNGKAASSHSHSGADITSGTVPYARLPVGSAASTVAAGNDSRLSDTRTPTDGTVTTAKIADGAVTPAKMGTGRVVGSANGTPASRTVWDGTQANYDAIASKDAATIYFVV